VTGKYDAVASGDSSHYTYFFYTSGKIHNVKIGPLEPDTVYYYRCGGVGDEFKFKTAPASLPVEFVVIGWSKITSLHLLLFVIVLFFLAPLLFLQ
jgi:acid phosphatase type 7